MFKRPKKLKEDPRLYIPKPARVCAIIQMCFAFSLLFWNVSDPFIGEYFRTKSTLLLYQDVMGIPLIEPHDEIKNAQLNRNSARFDLLPAGIRENILSQLEFIQKQLNSSFSEKMKSVFNLFAYSLSPYELAWIFFSIIISILLLKKREGAIQAVWILPLILICYAIDQTTFPPRSALTSSALFPSEEELIKNHLNEALSPKILIQKEQLTTAWKRYLIDQWTDMIPSKDSIFFNLQAEEGEFYFNVARLTYINSPSNAPVFVIPFPLFLLYFCWNVYFAYQCTRCQASLSLSAQKG